MADTKAKKNVKSYFDLSARERKRMIKNAVNGAQEEQLKLLKEYKSAFCKAKRLIKEEDK